MEFDYKNIQLVDRDKNGNTVYTVGRCFKCGYPRATGSAFLGGTGFVVACCRIDGLKQEDPDFRLPL